MLRSNIAFILFVSPLGTSESPQTFRVAWPPAIKLWKRETPGIRTYWVAPATSYCPGTWMRQ